VSCVVSRRSKVARSESGVTETRTLPAGGCLDSAPALWEAHARMGHSDAGRRRSAFLAWAGACAAARAGRGRSLAVAARLFQDAAKAPHGRVERPAVSADVRMTRVPRVSESACAVPRSLDGYSRMVLIPEGGSRDRLSLLERGMAAVEAPAGSQRRDQPFTRALPSESPDSPILRPEVIVKHQ